MNLNDVHSELGCDAVSQCGAISCSSMPKLKEHLKRHHDAMPPPGRHAESQPKRCPTSPADPPSGKYPTGIVPASKASSWRMIVSEEQEAEVLRRREERQRLSSPRRLPTEKIGRERQKQKAVHRQEAAAWKSWRERLPPDVSQPPAYEPSRRLLFPSGSHHHPMQIEAEDLEGTWQIYAEMGWVADLEKLRAHDNLAAAAPVVPCKGLIHLRRPGKGTAQKDDSGEDVNGDNEAAWRRRERQPMLVGSWHLLEHPEGHGKSNGTMHPFGAQRLATLAPADIRIFPSGCAMGNNANEEEAEEGEIPEERKEEEEKIDSCGWMMPSSWKCAGGELFVPGKWDYADEVVDIFCSQLHMGDTLKLRRLDDLCAKELSSLGNAEPEEAIEMLRAIWERTDDVVDLEAEPLLVRPGDMRITVQSEEGSGHGGVTTTSGNVYLCRREGPPPPPEEEPGREAPHVDEKHFERRKGKVRSNETSPIRETSS